MVLSSVVGLYITEIKLFHYINLSVNDWEVTKEKKKRFIYPKNIKISKMVTEISIPKEEYEELQFYKKLVENKLTEDVSEEELRLIEEARKEASINKKEFLTKAKKLL